MVHDDSHTPDLEFKDGIPRSKQFDEGYYSDGDGLEESRHVFIDGSGLLEHWQNRNTYTIGETGFGTGLNFLAVWRELENREDRPGILHFVSVENSPLSRDQMVRAHGAFPEIQDYSMRLLDVYEQPDINGFHRMWVVPGSVCLTLVIDEVYEALEKLDAKMDCWFLDGFSPSKNPAMWSKKVVDQLARLSRTDSILGTFTASGMVRRNLKSAGFSVARKPGFGKKREMISAVMESPRVEPNKAPWFANQTAESRTKSALVIGAGIAGCQCARHLAMRGWQVTVVDRNTGPGEEASGGGAAVVSPRVNAEPGLGEGFYNQALAYLRGQIRQVPELSPAFHNTGVLRLAHTDSRTEQWHRVQDRNLPRTLVRCLDSDEVSTVAGMRIEHPALFFAGGGWVETDQLCASLLDHPNIRFRGSTPVKNLQRESDSWKITTSSGEEPESFPVVIVANANIQELTGDSKGRLFPGLPVRGQSSTLAPSGESAELRCVIDHSGYVTPAHNGRHHLGATYIRNETNSGVLDSEDRYNVENLGRSVKGFATDPESLGPGHAAIRYVTPDRLPYVGPVPDEPGYRRAYGDLHHGRHWKDYPEPPYFPGLYAMSAFASRGHTSSAWCAEILASMINGDPLPAPRDILEKIHPARFLVRDLKRAKSS